MVFNYADTVERVPRFFVRWCLLRLGLCPSLIAFLNVDTCHFFLAMLLFLNNTHLCLQCTQSALWVIKTVPTFLDVLNTLIVNSRCQLFCPCVRPGMLAVLRAIAFFLFQGAEAGAPVCEALSTARSITVAFDTIFSCVFVSAVIGRHTCAPFGPLPHPHEDPSVPGDTQSRPLYPSPFRGPYGAFI